MFNLSIDKRLCQINDEDVPNDPLINYIISLLEFHSKITNYENNYILLKKLSLVKSQFTPIKVPKTHTTQRTQNL